LIGVASDIGAPCACDGSMAADSDGLPEKIICCAIAGIEPGLLRPNSTRTREHPGGSPLTRGAPSSDHGGVAFKRDRRAKAVEGRAIGGNELLNLAPGFAASFKDVRRALSRVSVYGREQGTEERRVSVDRHRNSEAIAIRAI